MPANDTETRSEIRFTPVEVPSPRGDDALSSAEAFSTYVEPELDFLARVSRRFSRSNAEADDLTQEVLTNAYRAIDRFDGRYPRAWLYRIASNAAASRARKKTPLLTFDGELDFAGVPELSDADPEQIVIDPIMDATLTDALDALPLHYRQVVNLVDVGGLSYEDAAQHLDIPMGTVMSRLHRGRRKLRAALAGSHLDRSSRRGVAAPV